MPGNDLLSHGEAPHYHRRSSVSLLSSGWDQVGPERYGCQAIRLDELRGHNTQFTIDIPCHREPHELSIVSPEFIPIWI